MANKSYWFPSQTGSYKTPNGRDLRIQIYYSNAGTVNTDVNVDLKDFGDIDFPFEIEDNGKFRLSKLNVKFLNTDNIFETEDIILASKSKETFMVVYLDGTEFWRGMVQHELIKKTSWFKDGSTLKYNDFAITAFDALHYFWLNDTTLSDVSYSSTILFEDLMENIIALLGFSASDLELDTSNVIEEPCGNNYQMNDLRLTGFSSSTLVRDFLIDAILGLGSFLYNLDGKVYFTRRIGGTTKAIDDDDILKIDVIANKDYTDYIAVSAVKDWGDLAFLLPEARHHFDTGTSGSNSNNFLVDSTGFLDNVFTRLSSAGSTYFGGCGIQTPTGENTVTSTKHVLQDEDENFYTEKIETGMVLEYNCVASSPESFGVIYNVDYDGVGPLNNVYIDDTGEAVDDGKDYRIFRVVNYGWAAMRIFKPELLCSHANDVYAEFFRTDPNLLKLKLRDVNSYRDFYKRYVFNSNNYRMRKMNIDLMTDTIATELAQVS